MSKQACERPPMLHPLWLLGPIGAITGLLSAAFLYRQTATDRGGEETEPSAREQGEEHVRAYLQQQAREIVSALSATFVLLLTLHFLELLDAAVAPAFLTGGLLAFVTSSLSVLLTARAADRKVRGLADAVHHEARSQAAVGLMLGGTALLFLSAGLYLVITLMGTTPLRESVVMMVSFGMGASLQALLTRLSEGVFTGGRRLAERANASASVETPDASGYLADTWSTAAGFSADLFESYLLSLLSAIALGAAAAAAISPSDSDALGRFVALPIAVAGLGLLASLAGTLTLRLSKEGDTPRPLPSTDRGLLVASMLMLLGSALVGYLLLKSVLLPNSFGWLGLWGCVILGPIAGLATRWSAAHFGSHRTTTSRQSPEAFERQAELSLIEREARARLGAAPLAALVILVLPGAFFLCGGVERVSLGLYGVALVSVGMLSLLASHLVTVGLEDPSSPTQIETADTPEQSPSTTEAAESFAVTGAALATLALLAAYGEGLKLALIRLAMREREVLVWSDTRIDEVAARAASRLDLMNWYQVTLSSPLALSGLILGATLWLGFSGLLLRATVRFAATSLTPHPQDETTPDESRPETTSSITTLTRIAQTWTRLPAFLALAIPLGLGLLLGPAAVMGLLGAGLATGFTAIAFSGPGSEKGMGGVKAAATRPALIGLVKFMASAAVVFAGLTVKFSPHIAHAIGLF